MYHVYTKVNDDVWEPPKCRYSHSAGMLLLAFGDSTKPRSKVSTSIPPTHYCSKTSLHCH